MVSRAPSGRSPSSSQPIKWRRPSPSSPFASTPQPSPSHRLPRATSSFLLVVPVPATPPHRPELRRTLPPPPSGSQPSPLPWPRLCFARGKPKHCERRLLVAPPPLHRLLPPLLPRRCAAKCRCFLRRHHGVVSFPGQALSSPEPRRLVVDPLFRVVVFLQPSFQPKPSPSSRSPASSRSSGRSSS